MRQRLVQVLVVPLLLSMGSVAAAQPAPAPTPAATAQPSPTTAPVPFGKPKQVATDKADAKPAAASSTGMKEKSGSPATNGAPATKAETTAAKTDASVPAPAPAPAMKSEAAAAGAGTSTSTAAAAAPEAAPGSTVDTSATGDAPVPTEASPTEAPASATPHVDAAPGSPASEPAPSAPVLAEDGAAAESAEPAPTHAAAPAPVQPSAATAAATPLLHYGRAQDFNAQLTGQLRASYLGLQGIASDRDGTLISASPLETRVRLAPQIRYRGLGLIGEVDLATGALLGMPGAELRLGQSSHPGLALAELRQLYLEYRGDTFVVRAGQQASNWGLGLVANNGSADAAPGEFGDARYGDLTYRAAIAGRPFFGLGGAWRAIEPIVAVDMIVRDDTADYFKGDRAVQGVLALRFAADADRNIGIYTVYRQQRLEGAVNGERSTDAYVVDVAGRWKWANPRNDYETKVGFEAAWITGQTTMARSDTAPVLDLDQFGAVAKLSSRIRAWEGYLDLGYASGDQNPYDTSLQSFRSDADFNAGLILFDEVLAWQSARTFARATDPDVVGLPPEGADLLPTRGAVTGAVYAFPRVRHGVREWLDVYGGPLFAFSTAALVDPFNTRVDGGTPRNALGGTPGGYLGTELDMGVQARLKPVNGMALSATGEVGYFIPGNAFADADGRNMPPVAAGRVRLSMSF